MTTAANQTKLIEQEGIEWGIVEGENTEFAAQYPRFQWVHGSKQAAGFMKVGGLFVSKEQYPNFTGEGFEPTTLITRKGDEIEGYAASSAKLAVVRVKHQWVKDATYGRNVPLAHVLCAVKGCDDLVCISLKGASKALEFQKAFNQHIGQNVAVANRTRPEGSKPIEPFALWFPVKAGEQVTITSKDGKSESAVTLPILDAPEKVDREYVTTLWVGATNYKTFVGFYKETDAWQKTPIWEQHGETDDTPTHSGGDDRATQAQIEHIAGICEAKGMDIQELCMTATNGATDNLASLTKQEASEIIETAKAYC